MSNNIVEAIDRISKSLGGNAASNNATEAIDKLSVALNGKLKGAEYDLTWTQIVNDIQAGDFSRYAVGDILTCKYGEYDNPLRIVDIREEELEDGTTRKGMWLQQKYATADTVQFSRGRALFYFEEGLAAGTYNFTLSAKFSNDYPANTVLSFTIENDVPAGGKLAFSTTSLDTAKVLIYAEDGKTLLEEGSILTKETAGTSLGDVAVLTRSGNTNNLYEALYGNNLFEFSAARQWLNSDKSAGEWWEAKDNFDIAPNNLNEIDGYLSKLPKSLVAALRPAKTVTVGNTAVYSNAEAETFDLITLPSKEQMYIAKQSNNEGAAFSYWQELNGTNSTFADFTAYDALKIGSIDKPDTPCNIFLRSAGVGNPYGVWYVSLYGSVNRYAAASTQFRFLPIMFIC